MSGVCVRANDEDVSHRRDLPNGMDLGIDHWAMRSDIVTDFVAYSTIAAW